MNKAAIMSLVIPFMIDRNYFILNIYDSRKATKKLFEFWAKYAGPKATQIP